MSSGPSNFRKTDVKRAVQAMEGAGRKLKYIEIRGNGVRIVPADGTAEDDPEVAPNSFDNILQMKK